MKMRGKLFVLVSLIFLILPALIGIVNAATCSDSQRIMKLYSPTNSHGEVYNGTGNYQTEICYDSIFGITGNGIRTCSGTNKLVNLFSSTNAHAEIPSGTAYTTPICYGDLTCTVGNKKCNNAGEKMVLALYQNNNSHLADPNYKPSGIVSWWRFDDNLQDSVGDNDGTMGAGTANYVNGKVGRAFNFTGSNYVEVADNPSIQAKKPMSVEAWVKRSAIEQGNDILIKRGPTGTASAGWEFAETNDSKLKFTFFGVKDTYSTGTITDTNWHHVAATIDASGNVKFYIDGNNAGTELISEAPLSTSAPLRSGVSVNVSGNIRTYNKFTLDDLAIYNVTLTPEEIQHRYNLGMYEKKICCKTGEIPAITGAYWTNMNDVKINTTNMNDEVKLNIESAAITGTIQINYTVNKCETVCQITGGIIKWFDKKMAQTSGRDSIVWVAGEEGDFYFTAELPDGTEYNSFTTPTYGILKVISPADNKFPVVIMNEPESESKHLINSNIDFKQSSYDEDDVINAIWNFGDGNITTLYRCNNFGNCNTTHKYGGNGAKTVRLTAKENRVERGQENSTARRIYVYSEGINIFAVISEPNPININVPVIGAVRFNGSLSYVANCTNCIIDVCPACPTGKNCYNVSNSSMKIQCYDLDKSDIAASGAGKYNLWFNWTFDEAPYNRYGDWANNYSYAVVFSKGFMESKEHQISLRVGYEPF